MRKLFKLSSLILFFVFLKTAVEAQTISPSVINTSGGTYSGTAFSVSWAVGEAVVTTISSGSNMITQGFLQPSPLVSTGIKTTWSGDIMTVYPNPFQQEIRINSSISNGLHISIFSMLGEKVYDGMYNSSAIDLSFLKPGGYILMGVKEGHSVNVRIIKN